MLRTVAGVTRASRMLHSILHRNRTWRQGGTLQCTFCTSARLKCEDPLGKVQNNPYFDKYAEKIRKKHQESPEAFSAHLREAEAAQDQARADAVAAAQIMEESIVENMKMTKQKKLDDVLKVDLIKDESAERIGEIWSEFHSQKDCVHAIIPADDYKEMFKRAKQFPTFVYPLPREQGYEFILQQWDGHDIHFTPLIAYQTYQDSAPTCFNVAHYTELMEDKGIVLMVGEPDSKVMSIHEAQLLALQVKLYYGLQSGLKFNYVRQFANAPDSFRYIELVREFENVKKDARSALDSLAHSR